MGAVHPDYFLYLLIRMPAISASAPGKIILCGEHSVVYGFPAIAIPVFEVQSRTVVLAKPSAKTGEVRLIAPAIGMETSLLNLEPSDPVQRTIDLVLQELGVDHLPACEIRISSSIPLGSGLGSSTSVSVSMLRALSEFLGHPFSDTQVNQLAYEIEKIHHGNPSGIDNSVITFQKPVFFQRDHPIHLLEVNAPLHLLIADSGVAASTADAVNGVRQRWQDDPRGYNHKFAAIGDLVFNCKRLMELGEIAGLGNLLNQNHMLLQEIQISSPVLDNLVSAALNAGADGAKLSGGGIGGNIIALVNEAKAESVTNALTRAGAVRVLHTELPFTGAPK